jgi:hypothetical protein
MFRSTEMQAVRTIPTAFWAVTVQHGREQQRSGQRGCESDESRRRLAVRPEDNRVWARRKSIYLLKDLEDWGRASFERPSAVTCLVVTNISMSVYGTTKGIQLDEIWSKMSISYGSSRGTNTSLALKENNKLREWKNVLTLHIVHNRSCDCCIFILCGVFIVCV